EFRRVLFRSGPLPQRGQSDAGLGAQRAAPTTAPRSNSRVAPSTATSTGSGATAAGSADPNWKRRPDILAFGFGEVGKAAIVAIGSVSSFVANETLRRTLPCLRVAGALENRLMLTFDAPSRTPQHGSGRSLGEAPAAPVLRFD